MSKCATLLVLLVVVVGSLAQSKDYCAICKDHTVCQYTQDPGPRCQSLLKSGVTGKQRKEIVDAHNEMRAKVTAGLETNGTNGGQPSASNMRKMKWDNELAKVAQHWVDQCNYKHDTCRNVDRFSVGQNILMAGSSVDEDDIDWRATVENWYSEVNKFDRNGIAVYDFDENTAHYTQLVWANTNKVGCGFSKYPENGWYISFYGCNYGPAGNVYTQSIYEEGVPCTKCPKKTKICENGLCV